MSEKICKFNKDEFCVNGNCPMRADYCPTAQHPGVCKYEELVDIPTRLSPIDCLAAALKEANVPINDRQLLAAFDAFVVSMKNNGYAIEGNVDAASSTNEDNPKEEVVYTPGMVVDRNQIEASEIWDNGYDLANGNVMHRTRDKKLRVCFAKCEFTGVVLLNTIDYEFTDFKDELKIGYGVSRSQVDKSNYWHCKSFSGEPYNTSACYISVDGRWVVRFNDGEEYAKIAPWYKKEEFQVGKQVHVGAIGESREWMYVGEKNDLATYMTRDKLLTVTFRRDSDWGTIMLNREAVDANKKANANNSDCSFKEGDEVRIMDLYGSPDWQEVFCKDEIAEFRSKDGTLGATFTEESTTAIIYRRNI